MSALGQLFKPIFDLLAGGVALFYQLVPNYAVAITLLTLAVMAVLTPLTIKQTRSMLVMQRLQPEMKRIQAQWKHDRQRLNEELMAFYKEHKVNPAAGCLPLFLQMPFFFIMYRVINGLTHFQHGFPKYISHTSRLAKDLVTAACGAAEKGVGCPPKTVGKMPAFGLDLAKAATSSHTTFLVALPFFVLVALTIVTQYVQAKQMTGRTPNAAQDPNTRMMSRVMPVMFGVIYFSIPAGVVIYFLVSNVFRIAQQELMYRYDPVLLAEVSRDVKIIEAKADAKDGGQGKDRGQGKDQGKGQGKNQGKNQATTDGKGSRWSKRGPDSSSDRRPTGKPGKSGTSPTSGPGAANGRNPTTSGRVTPGGTARQRPSKGKAKRARRGR